MIIHRIALFTVDPGVEKALRLLLSTDSRHRTGGQEKATLLPDRIFIGEGWRLLVKEVLPQISRLKSYKKRNFQQLKKN